ncbi:MAG TPA: ATP-binding cassette domain-containing protein [Candidatus Eisenbacteria bacterium]|nr:ATP-binding cassette domain-containing protein [Candidatus Eisenbacteria bacterium]
MKAIEARGLLAVHRSSGGAVAALRGLDLDVEAGEIVAVVGPSGSGKTTLLRILASAEAPTAGSVSVFGTALERADPRQLRRHRREIVGVVDQHYRRALSPYLPAAEIAGLPLALRGRSPGERAARVAELLAATGLGDRQRARSAELSGGEQQRLAVAAALAFRPRLLLADEPTGELDADATARLLELIRDLVRADGATAVIVTHDPAVEAIADRVVILEDGRAVATRLGPLGEPEVPAVDAAGWHAPETTWRHARPAPAPPTEPASTRADEAPAGEAVAAVVLEGVSRRYGGAGRAVEALDDLNALIPARGVTAITGPSGSGKSTLVRLIAGLDRPDSGRVLVLGRDLAGLDREELAMLRSTRIGIAEQARGLVPFLTVRENVELAVAVRAAAASEPPGPPAQGPSGASDDGGERVTAILERLGLAHLGARQPGELSAGERTRVAIARALVTEPALLVLDEPTATLDRVNAARVAELLAGLGTELAVVVATHDPVLVDIAGSRIELARPGAAR